MQIIRQTLTEVINNTEMIYNQLNYNKALLKVHIIAVCVFPLASTCATCP